MKLISGPPISLLRYKAIIFFDLIFSFSFLGDYELSMEQAQLLSDQTGKSILPGELVCITCKKHLLNLHPEDTDASVQNVSEGHECDFPEPITQTASTLNTSLFQLDCSPLKLHEIKWTSRISYGKRKLKEVSDRIGEGVAK